jgi:hypothetical protein
MFASGVMKVSTSILNRLKWENAVALQGFILTEINVFPVKTHILIA